MKNWVISLALIIACISLQAQNIGIGSWRTHFSYHNARLITTSPTRVYCAVENGLFSLDLSEKSTTKITKISGLSGAGVSALQYNQESNVLVIGYKSGLIDLVFENDIISIRDIYSLREEFDKTIFDLDIHDGTVYAATNIGVIVISLKEQGIVDNFRSIGANAADISVFELLVSNQSLYAITGDGIQVGSLSDNLLDFNNWNLLDLDPTMEYQHLSAAENQVFVSVDNLTLSQIQGDTIESIAVLDEPIKKLKALNGGLGVLLSSELLSFDPVSSASGLVSLKVLDNAQSLNDFSEDGFWFADGSLGLLDAMENPVVPNGPQSDKITNIEWVDGKIYAFFGPDPDTFAGEYDSLGYSAFSNGSWDYTQINGFYNIVDAEMYREKLYFASIGQGLYNATDGLLLDETNSGLSRDISNSGILISALESNGFLWVASYNNEKPLLLLDSEDTWFDYDQSLIGTTKPLDLDISPGETAWVTKEQGGITLFNTEETTVRLLSETDGLPSNLIYDVELDVNDEAWVATSEGIVNFSEATFISNDIPSGELVYDEATVYNELPVAAVSSDGGGRVWVAGENDLAVYSNNGLDRYFLFNETNSPLPSNTILDMAYNPENGEVFILTDRGLVSYRSNSSAPNPSHQNVSIFPNPVRPGYSGQVGIKGVVSNADIKITDVNGKLIRQVEAFGGSASWNLRDYNNARVRSGVYLVFSSSADGSETYVGKIAVVN
ncbi:MAG: T9SS type A sorting domain-containing protein [Cyclobacteriaceae bacterium]